MHMIRVVAVAADVVEESRRRRRRWLKKQLHMPMRAPRRKLRGLLPPSPSLRRVVDAAVVVDALSTPWPRMHQQRRWLGEDSSAAVKPVAVESSSL